MVTHDLYLCYQFVGKTNILLQFKNFSTSYRWLNVALSIKMMFGSGNGTQVLEHELGHL